MVQTPIQIWANSESWIKLLVVVEFMLNSFIFKQNINILILNAF